MAPHAENPKVCSSKTEKKKIQDELLEKLKVDEEREKKKLEKEAKRRAELEKIKSESLVRQANLLAPLKKEKNPVQSRNTVMKSQPKKINNKKQQSHKSENKNNQASSYESNSSGSNKREPSYSERRFSRGSSSSENSWKRNEWRNCQSNSKYAPVSDSPWGNTDEHFPMLGAEAPVPQVNVWEERKYKQEEIQALRPQNEYDEEAMLQQALVLSVMEATKEENRKKKLEEEYRLQMSALEHNPEMLQKFDALDDFTVTDKSKHESCNVLLKSTEEQNLNESFSRNVAVSSFSQRDTTSSAGGARPKLNKIIDSFGGWGLKDTKKEKNCDTLSNFVGDIVNEKPSWKAAKFNSSHDSQRDVSSNNAKKPEKVVDRWLKSEAKIEKPVDSDSWTPACNNDVKKSPVSDPWGENQVLYDGKGTFTDIDEDKLNYPNPADNSDTSSKEKDGKLLKEESSGDVLDKWLNSEDESAPVSNGWDDDIVPGGKLNDSTAANIQTDSVSYFDSAPSNYAVTKCENSQGSFSNFETVMSVKDDKSNINSSKEYDSMGISSKTINTKGISSDIRSIKKQNELSQSNILSEFESTYNYIVGDTGKSKDGPVNAQTLLSNGNSWNDELSNQSPASSTVSQNQNLPKTELAWEEAPNKFGTVEESKIFSAMASNEEIDTPPILPPKSVPSVPLVNELNQTLKAEMSGDQCTEKSPPILPPQASSEMPSQYLFNPTMFPGVNPMLGLGMDPITMRQMLMLSNPFFASQLLAMEQYYRAMGMPVDLFSFPQTVPNLPFPGMANASMEQNTHPSTVNAAAHVSHLQNQYQDQSVLMPGNKNSVSTEKHLTKYPPGLDQDVAAASTPGTLENNDDSWYSSVLSSDSAPIIPPPKPPVLNNNPADSKSISEPSETSESASSFCYNNMNSQQYVNDNPSSGLLGGENHKSLSAVEACMTKTEISGWGDIDLETPSKCKSKTNPWDDDGWGTDNLPTKSIKHSSVYEEKKKIVHRQPARQPQFSRFQNNRRFN